MGSKKIMHTQTIDALIDTINYTHKQIQSEEIKSVSRSLTFRNWIIGYYIVEYEQNGKDRAMYGDRLMERLAKKLSKKSGQILNRDGR